MRVGSKINYSRLCFEGMELDGFTFTSLLLDMSHCHQFDDYALESPFSIGITSLCLGIAFI